MSVVRVRKEDNYVTVNRTSLRDERLSWKAKGLHVYMLSMPNDWVFYDTELAKHAKDGIDSLRSAMAELKKYGYTKKEAKRNDDGTIERWETIVYEVPHLEDEEEEGEENPAEEEVAATATQSAEPPRKNDYPEDFESFWKVYPRQIEKKSAYDKWKLLMKKKVDPNLLVKAATNYAKTVRDPEFARYPATFLAEKTRPFMNYIEDDNYGPAPSSSKPSQTNRVPRMEDLDIPDYD